MLKKMAWIWIKTTGQNSRDQSLLRSTYFRSLESNVGTRNLEGGEGKWFNPFSGPRHDHIQTQLILILSKLVLN